MKNIGLNDTVYNKIIVQAEEAKELGFERLANDVLGVMGPLPRDSEEKVTYSSVEIKNDVRSKLWKIAMEYIKYHDVDGVDIQKVDETVSYLLGVVAREMEIAIDSRDKVGSLEPEVPGQSK